MPGIQDGESNTTRFYILSYGQDVPVPLPTSPPCQERALIRVLPANDTGGWDTSRAIKAVDMPISRIDRRPSLCSKTFRDVYFLEVYAEGGQGNNVLWFRCIEQAVERLRQAGLDSTVLGTW